MLTEEELHEVYSKLSPRTTFSEREIATCQAQDTKTLRDVENYLDIMQNFSGVELYHAFRRQFLLQGEMPELSDSNKL